MTTGQVHHPAVPDDATLDDAVPDAVPAAVPATGPCAPGQATAPYAEALEAHAHRDPLMLMVPSHAGTREGLSAGLAGLVGERAVRMDIPQLVDGIDVGPDSAFARAERLAGEAWHSRRTWFLANGSSQGNRLAVVAVAALGLGPGIVAQRSAHSSLVDGLVVTGLRPHWVAPAVDEALGINHGVTAAAVGRGIREARAAGSAPAAVYVVSPSYFGAVADVRALADTAHEFGLPLIVDAAWGAHFGFHEELPRFPTQDGADVVISSTHKMGGALGQGAMLHLGETELAAGLEPHLQRAHQLTQTTSASSLLLGSLDVARRALATGAEALGRSIAAAADLREQLRALPELRVVSDGFGAFPDIVDADPLRISLDVSGTGLTGYEIRSALANDHAVLVEIATVGAIAAFLGPGKELDLARFERALRAVIDGGRGRRQGVGRVDSLRPPAQGESVLTPREAYFGASEEVPTDEAVGRVSADALAAYPPGVPNVLPGERISAEAVAYLRAVAASPLGYVRGALDAGLHRVRVVR